MPKQRPPLSNIGKGRLPDDLTATFKEKILSLRTSVKTDYLKSEIFSKYVGSDTDSASLRRERAIAKWLQIELKNEETNERLFNTHEEYNILPRVTLKRFLNSCRSLICDIIGGETVPDEALIGSFSGGASTSRKRTESHPASKYLGKAHVTERCAGLFEAYADDMPVWLKSEWSPSLEVVPGNVMFTVPKKTDIDRVACKEPDVNMFFQKGVGAYFRKRLRRFGIDLNDQSINWKLAREGSLCRNLATLDLSSASDSVTSGLVELLLPPVWFTTLDTLRCHVTIIDGEEHRNQMFSSMGNGFTFELESLLFFAIAKTVVRLTGTPGVVSVYGDDIICPSEAYQSLETALKWFGFTVNTEKSFYEGPFRESCGGHFYDGVDITPFYVKEEITTIADVIDVANKLRKWARIPGLGILNPEVEDIWLWLKSLIPSQLWGGADLNSKYQLVSEDLSSHRLFEESKKHPTGVGGYLHWLNATWDRTQPGDGIETSSRTVTRSVYRMRRVRTPTVSSFSHSFYHEVMRDREASR